MFLILFVSLVLGILGACYAPEIRLWIDSRSKDWKNRWDTVDEIINPKNEESDDTNSNE